MPGGQRAPDLTDSKDFYLWERLCSHQGETFTTSGRGRRKGTPFTYTIRGAEMFVSSRSKSITRSTILYAYKKVRSNQAGGGTISGPKSIGVHGDSYIFAVFKAFGVITAPATVSVEMRENEGETTTLDSRDKIEIQKTEKEAYSMPRPKGSKNKKSTVISELVETVESIDERIVAVEAAIATLTDDLKAKKVELKKLTKLRADAERVAAEKKAEEDKNAILAAVEASGKSVEEILELLKRGSTIAPSFFVLILEVSNKMREERELLRSQRCTQFHAD